jgi:hypothetical protein
MTFEEQINLCADKVCAAIRDNKMVDLDDIHRIIRTNMILTMEGMFYSEDQKLADDQMRLIRERDLNATTSRRRAELNIKIQEIAQKRKAVRMKIGKMHDEDQYLLLKKFIIERFGREVLDEFFALHPAKQLAKIKNP